MGLFYAYHFAPIWLLAFPLRGWQAGKTATLKEIKRHEDHKR